MLESLPPPVAAMVIVLASGALVGQSAPGDRELISAIPLEPLAAALDAEIDPSRSAVGGPKRCSYALKLHSGGTLLLDMGVFPSVADARRSYLWLSSMPQVLGKPDEHLGDESLVWGTGGHILFRRDNAVFSLTAREQDLRPIATSLDRLVCRPDSIATHCREGEMPAIETLDVPTRLVRPRDRDQARDTQRWPRFSVRLRNSPDTDALRVFAGSQGVANWASPTGGPATEMPIPVRRGEPTVRPPRADEDGRFMLRVDPTAPLGKQDLTIVVVTPGNLILTRDVEVEIVPAD